MQTILDLEEAADFLRCPTHVLHNMVWAGAGPSPVDPRAKWKPLFTLEALETWKEEYGAKDKGALPPGQYAGIILSTRK